VRNCHYTLHKFSEERRSIALTDCLCNDNSFVLCQIGTEILCVMYHTFFLQGVKIVLPHPSVKSECFLLSPFPLKILHSFLICQFALCAHSSLTCIKWFQRLMVVLYRNVSHFELRALFDDSRAGSRASKWMVVTPVTLRHSQAALSANYLVYVSCSANCFVTVYWMASDRLSSAVYKSCRINFLLSVPIHI